MLVKVLRSLHAGVAVVRRSIGQALLGNELALRHLLSGSSVHLSTPLSIAATTVHASVPPILDGVVTAATKAAGNLGPSLAHLSDHLLNHLSLLGCDGVMVEIGLEILVVSLPALLGGASTHHAGNAHPVVGTLGMDETHKDVVFLLRPRASLVCRHVGWS